MVDGQVVEDEEVLLRLLGYRAARHAAALVRSASRRAGFRPTNRAAVPTVPGTGMWRRSPRASHPERQEPPRSNPLPQARLHDTTGDDLGVLEHPAPNLEPGNVVVVADGREAVVTERVEAEPGPRPLVAMLEVVIAPSRLEADDALP